MCVMCWGGDTPLPLPLPLPPPPRKHAHTESARTAPLLQQGYEDQEEALSSTSKSTATRDAAAHPNDENSDTGAQWSAQAQLQRQRYAAVARRLQAPSESSPGKAAASSAHAKRASSSSAEYSPQRRGKAGSRAGASKFDLAESREVLRRLAAKVNEAAALSPCRPSFPSSADAGVV